MSDFVGGIVKRITEKQGKFGPMFSIQLQHDDGSEQWYGFGKFPPKFGEGSDIEFGVTWNGQYANADFKTVKVVSLVEPAQQGGGRQRGGDAGSNGAGRGSRSNGSTSGSAGRGGNAAPPARGGVSKPAAKSDGLSKDEWARKDAVIQLQSCRNSAIAVVAAALQHEALPLPAKKGEKFDALVGAVNELTEQFFLGNDDVDRLLKARAEKDDKPPFRGGHEQGEYDEDDDGLPGEE